MVKKPRETDRRLFRVIFRGHDYLGIVEEWHAKVVAPDFSSATAIALDNLKLDPKSLAGSAVTLITDETELPSGKVIDVARRSRAFGGRGGWMLRDELPERMATGPRKTPLL